MMLAVYIMVLLFVVGIVGVVVVEGGRGREEGRRVLLLCCCGIESSLTCLSVSRDAPGGRSASLSAPATGGGSEELGKWGSRR